MTSTIDIRVLNNNEDMRQMYQLEEFIWQGEGGIPVHQTITAIRNGGLAIGAYCDDQLVGFSYSFAGFKDGKAYLCSHNMGIHPEYRDRGIGASLKNRQKTEAVQIGYDMLTWTYDPLETRNGYLNLSKLHAVCSTYIENCYGEFDDGLNAGLPTDRFKVEWWVKSRHVNEHLQTPIEDDAFYIPWKETASGPILAMNGEIPDAKQVMVPVPASFQTIKQDDMKFALDWRLKTRAIFQELFQKGYAAVSLERNEEGPVHHYMFIKRSASNLNSEKKGKQ